MLRITEGKQAAGRWARVQRERSGWSVEAVAKRAGVSPTTVRNLELGQAWPYPNTRNKIERALEINQGSLTDYAYYYDQELDTYASGDREREARVHERLRKAAGE